MSSVLVVDLFEAQNILLAMLRPDTSAHHKTDPSIPVVSVTRRLRLIFCSQLSPATVIKDKLPGSYQLL
jgi:hypothetical protein